MITARGAILCCITHLQTETCSSEQTFWKKVSFVIYVIYKSDMAQRNLSAQADICCNLMVPFVPLLLST